MLIIAFLNVQFQVFYLKVKVSNDLLLNLFIIMCLCRYMTERCRVGGANWYIITIFTDLKSSSGFLLSDEFFLVL